MYFRKLATFVAAAALSCFSFSTAFADFAVGDRGMEVIEIQKQLAVLHYNVGEIDGVFGPATEKAVKDFQTAKGLKVDGIVNDATRIPLEECPREGLTAPVLYVMCMAKPVFPCRGWLIPSIIL